MAKKFLEQPRYEIIGDLERMDQADTIMARRNLIPDSDTWAKYYEKKKGLEATGREWVELQQSQAARTAIPPQDALMAAAMYTTIHAMSGEDAVDGEAAPEAIHVGSQRASEKIKGLARSLGADLVGIGPLNAAWTYSHRAGDDQSGCHGRAPVSLDHQHAIVLAVHYERAKLDCAPHFAVGLATLEIYVRLCGMVTTLARYIRSLGYNAKAHTPFNSQVLDVPLAIDAGLGELGRSGILINEEYGSNFKPMCVTTNMPLKHDMPVDIGVDEFCSTCRICARVCPSGAIPRGDKSVVRGVRKWKLNPEPCFGFWLYTGGNCSLCISCCPWTRLRTFPHNIVVKAVQRSALVRRIAIMGDTLNCREKKGRIPAWLEAYPEVWRNVLKRNHPFYRERRGMETPMGVDGSGGSR